jgi:hypothetical protein
MFNLPVPFIEKGALKTWDINLGYDLDCDCGQLNINLSGATITIDLSNIEAQLDDLIALATANGTTLVDILTELVLQNKDVAQTFLTTAVAGNIPAGVQSYTIINLGVDPNNPLSPANAMIIGGVTLNTKVLTFGNATDSNQVLDAAIPYDPNGNTLAIIYNVPNP